MKHISRKLFIQVITALSLSCLSFGTVSVVSYATPITVGDECGGGKVVYVLLPGDLGYKPDEQHGLIAAKEDLPDETPSWFEAKAAAERLEVSGFKGWSLPTKEELSLLYQQQAVVGGFRDYCYYWSASELDKLKAWALDFYNGEKIISSKSGALSGIRRIRPVRKF
jgi:formylglycine-generating enzyme required for sulfatase activity